MNTLICLFALVSIFLALNVEAAAAETNSMECAMCNYIVSYVDEMLKNNKTEQEIDTFLENDVCTLAPKAYESMCDGVVESYGPTIMTALANKEDPATVCQTQTHLCPPSLDGGIISDVKCAIECGIETYDAFKDCGEAYEEAAANLYEDFECGKALWDLGSKCGVCVYDHIKN